MLPHSGTLLCRLAFVHLPENAGADAPLHWEKQPHDYEYIGEAELAAIVAAVRHAASLWGGEPLSLIIVATDSLVARGWVERGYSSRPVARDLLAELTALLADYTRISCHYVRSDDNVADDPSRTALDDSAPGAIVPRRLAATLGVLRGALASTIRLATETGRSAVAGRRRPRLGDAHQEALFGKDLE